MDLGQLEQMFHRELVITRCLKEENKSRAITASQSAQTHTHRNTHKNTQRAVKKQKQEAAEHKRLLENKRRVLFF